jgi:hypothetical protein
VIGNTPTALKIFLLIGILLTLIFLIVNKRKEESKVNGDSKTSSTGKKGATIFLISFFNIKIKLV